MIRPILTQLALFAAPFVAYAAFLWATRAGVFHPDSWPLATVAWLSAAATILVAGSFVLLASYSGVPAGMLGRTQVIEVGPMSGISNVQCWLENHNIEPRSDLVDAIFRRAKESDCVLTDSEILAVVQGFAPALAGSKV